MNSYAVFHAPQKILYGRDSFLQTGKEAAATQAKKALIVTDEVMTRLGYVDQCEQLLLAEGISSIVYRGVATEPTDQYVAEALALLQQEACDLVISLGGGSCIDTAKAIVVLDANGGYIGDIREKPDCLAPRIPHIAIPTTAGTGSEATDVTVITNTADDVKMMLKNPVLMPTIAIVDPYLTRSAPPSVIAATGIDALSHAIEAFLSKKAHPLTNTLATSAIQHITSSLKRSYDDPYDLDAKERMCIGSLQAGMAFSNASVALVHGMSRPIGALFHVPHGISNAMLLPAVLEFSLRDCTKELAALLPLFQPETGRELMTVNEKAQATIQQIKELCQHLHIPNLRDWGIPEQAFRASLEKMAHDALASGSPGNNPRVPTKDELIALYVTCYDYTYDERPIGQNR